MAVEFYSVKHRRKVQVDEGEIEKKTYERETSKGKQTRYAFQAQTNVDGDQVKAPWRKSCSSATARPNGAGTTGTPGAPTSL
jgi:hypothetical protein